MLSNIDSGGDGGVVVKVKVVAFQVVVGQDRLVSGSNQDGAKFHVNFLEITKVVFCLVFFFKKKLFCFACVFVFCKFF